MRPRVSNDLRTRGTRRAKPKPSGYLSFFLRLSLPFQVRLSGFFLCVFFVPLGAALGTETVYTVTAYCPCAVCTGFYSGGPTASGAKPRHGVTIAAPRSIPFGTVLEIEGIGRRVVQDRAALAYDRRIDLFVRSHTEAKRFGTRQLRVIEVLGKR